MGKAKGNLSPKTLAKWAVKGVTTNSARSVAERDIDRERMVPYALIPDAAIGIHRELPLNSEGTKREAATEEELHMIRELAAVGLPIEQIARAFRCGVHGKNQFQRLFGDVMRAARANADYAVSKTLFNRGVEDGDVGALIWWEKTRQNRNPTHKVETSSVQTQRVEIDVSGFSTEELMRLKDVVDEKRLEADEIIEGDVSVVADEAEFEEVGSVQGPDDGSGPAQLDAEYDAVRPSRRRGFADG